MAGVKLPIPMRWDAQTQTMTVLSGHTRRAADQFGAGGVFAMVELQDRSPETHRHFFATVREAWKNLDERDAERFPSDVHLRKWALIKAGFCDQRSMVCASNAEAQRVAAFMRRADGYDLVVIRGKVLTQYTAHSQAVGAMKPDVFQRSKEGVFRVLSERLGVEVTDLRKAAA